MRIVVAFGSVVSDSTVDNGNMRILAVVTWLFGATRAVGMYRCPPSRPHPVEGK
jgi:hypothetical protein